VLTIKLIKEIIHSFLTICSDHFRPAGKDNGVLKKGAEAVKNLLKNSKK
jgi:hypothetical protein